MQPLNLQNNDVHLWILNPQQIKDTKHFLALLTPLEEQKVKRYRLPQAQRNALLTRAFVRLILSQYEIRPASQWHFDINALGKPEVSNTTRPLRFNLSHNNDLIICAITLEKDIGCDIENLARKINVKSISKRYFSVLEQQQLNALPDNQKNAFFFKLWTLKEAFVKATGLGIAQGLDTFSFNLAEQRQKEQNIHLMFSQKCSEQDARRWQSHLFYPDDTHCIALCVKSEQTMQYALNIQLFDEKKSLALFKEHSF
ncbi:4-phosphopantetheinyl transferase [Psychromonas sp. PRT-SC03]|nr:4-phosphopantetheinyl transferase [Psychromonas sp. PRT-SC03]